MSYYECEQEGVRELQGFMERHGLVGELVAAELSWHYPTHLASECGGQRFVWYAAEDPAMVRLQTFLGSCYEASYGSQQLFGTLWFTDGRWATRGEYDGSEWWQLHSLPPLPSKEE